MFTIENRAHTIYYGLLNLTIVAALIGAVVLIANNLTQIPALWFISGFGLLTLMLLMGGWLAQRTQAHGARTIWSFWAGIAYGLTLFAGGHWFGLSTFIPDLLLLWIVGLALLAFWNGSTLQMMLVAGLTGIWLYLVFLYGYSYMPGLLIIMAIYAFAGQRRFAPSIFLAAIVLTLILLNLYAYDLLFPAHFPLQFSITQLLITLALVSSLHAVVALLESRNAAQSPWPAYGEALHKLTQVIGVLALLPFAFWAPWEMLRAAFDGGLVGLVLGFALLMVTAILVFGRQTSAALRATFCGWALGYLLVAIGIDDHMLDMMHFSGQAYLPLIGIGMTVAAAGAYLVSGLYRICLVRMSVGVGLLFVAAMALMMEWVNGYRGQVVLWVGVALVLWIATQNLHRQLNPLSAPLSARPAPRLRQEAAL